MHGEELHHLIDDVHVRDQHVGVRAREFEVLEIGPPIHQRREGRPSAGGTAAGRRNRRRDRESIGNAGSRRSRRSEQDFPVRDASRTPRARAYRRPRARARGDSRGSSRRCLPRCGDLLRLLVIHLRRVVTPTSAPIDSSEPRERCFGDASAESQPLLIRALAAPYRPVMRRPLQLFQIVAGAARSATPANASGWRRGSCRPGSRRDRTPARRKNAVSPALLGRRRTFARDAPRTYTIDVASSRSPKTVVAYALMRLGVGRRRGDRPAAASSIVRFLDGGAPLVEAQRTRSVKSSRAGEAARSAADRFA